MTPSTIRAKVVLERAAWIREMLDAIKLLPFESFDEFNADRRNPDSAESCLRRALEALLDLGRHILAKQFGRGVVQYKEIAAGLAECRVLDAEAADLLKEMAGYRNRMVHFYNEITREEWLKGKRSQLHSRMRRRRRTRRSRGRGLRLSAGPACTSGAAR